MIKTTQLMLLDDYMKVQEQAIVLCDKLKELVREKLAKAEPQLTAFVEWRVKKVDSCMEKIERKELNLASVLELDDLIGLRVILLFKRDVERAIQVLSDIFQVISREDTADRLEETQFGYLSKDLVVRPPTELLRQAWFNKLRDPKVEVQVRTMAQHLWASGSHVLQYKQEASVPKPVRRSIHRVSALLEIVDLEFERVLEEREKYEDAGEQKQPKALLNSDILARVLDEELPQENKKEGEPYAEVLADLEAFKIMTTGDLRKLIRTHVKSVVETDKAFAAKFQEEANLSGEMRERVNRGVYHCHTGLVRGIMVQEFGDDWIKYASDKRAMGEVR